MMSILWTPLSRHARRGLILCSATLGLACAVRGFQRAGIADQTATKDCDNIKELVDRSAVGDKVDEIDPFQSASTGLPRPNEMVVKYIFRGCSMELHIDLSSSSV